MRGDVLGDPDPGRLAQLGVRLLVDLHLSRPLLLPRCESEENEEDAINIVEVFHT